MAAKYSATVLNRRAVVARERERVRVQRYIEIRRACTCGSETRRWVSLFLCMEGSLLLLGITVDGLTLCTRQVHDDPCFTEAQAPVPTRKDI